MAFDGLTLFKFVSGLSDILLAMAGSLDRAVRLGADSDEPEGARYAQFSDTLLNNWSAGLRDLAGALGGFNVKTTAELDLVRGGSQERAQDGLAAQDAGTGAADAVAGR